MDFSLFFVSVVFCLAAGLIPQLIGRFFSPGKGLVAGFVGVVAVLGFVLGSGARTLGTIDIVALSFLAHGIFVNYRLWDADRVIERGEAAIAAAEAQRK